MAPAVRPNAPRWSFDAAAVWWPLSKLGLGDRLLYSYKEAWIIYNRDLIYSKAKKHNISPFLLAGIAWIEVGGKPDDSKYYVYAARKFDWSGPDWVDRLAVTKPPTRTSFGPVAIQLRRAAEALGVNEKKLSASNALQFELMFCLMNDACNLDMVARHVVQLIKLDFPRAKTASLSDEQIRIVGARYFRGPELTLEQIRTDTDYGDKLLRNANRVKELMTRP